MTRAVDSYLLTDYANQYARSEAYRKISNNDGQQIKKGVRGNYFVWDAKP